MMPRSCQFLIAAASLLVPRRLRPDWKREWHAELWHRAESGASESELIDCARGAFRDAAWFRSSEFARADLLEDSFFVKPLRLELTVLALALVVCTWAGVWKYPELPYANSDRLVRFERGPHYAGAVDSIFNELLLKHLVQNKVIEQIATYRVFQGMMPGARVSSNFFDVLGVQPALGRTFREDDPETTVVISDRLWRRLHADPGIVGKPVRLPYGQYTVVGILPPSFWFTNDRLWYYAPMGANKRLFGAIALMKPGSTMVSTRDEARELSRKVKLGWMADSLQVLPVFEDPRKQEGIFSLSLGAAGAVLGSIFLMIRGLGGVNYRLLLAARLFIVQASLAAMWVAFARLVPGLRGPFSLLQLWIFLLVCIAAACLIVRDHGARCLVCFRRLRLPAPIGIWSSPILDQPGTEYACPAGHGMLYIAETRNDSDYWTVLDETWQDLFAHTHR